MYEGNSWGASSLADGRTKKRSSTIWGQDIESGKFEKYIKKGLRDKK